MALFVPGKTPCAVCGCPVVMSSEAVLFPAFLRAGHRLHRFSDGVFHSTCFDAWDHRDEFAQLYAKYQSIMSTRPRGVSQEEAERWAAEAFRCMDEPPDRDR